MSVKPKKLKSGFTVAELLIALAISGILLAAMAVAINASFINYQENEYIFKTINNARQALSRMTTQLRTASAVDPNTDSSQCSFITAGGEDITYRYNSSDNKLYLDNTSGSYVLCKDVSAMTFQKETASDEGVVYVKSVQILMTLLSGDYERTVSASAVIKKNL